MLLLVCLSVCAVLCRLQKLLFLTIYYKLVVSKWSGCYISLLLQRYIQCLKAVTNPRLMQAIDRPVSWVNVSAADAPHSWLSARAQDSSQRDGCTVSATSQLVRRRSRRQGLCAASVMLPNAVSWCGICWWPTWLSVCLSHWCIVP